MATPPGVQRAPPGRRPLGGHLAPDVSESNGSRDAQLTSFLKSRPAGVKVRVTLHHEPEDDVKVGTFTAAQFRAFGWAELGSPCISTDPTCAGRAAWPTSLGRAWRNLMTR